MRLKYVSLCGFRGFREPATLNFGAGFTVIVGPNGSGKSTICDAIEFALLGRMRPSKDHKERGESIDDYLWWRGAGTPKESYVALGFISESGQEYKVLRSPSYDGPIDRDLYRALILDGSAITNPIEQLCRTTILRDEDITRLSIDLQETDRFDFVRAALGSADFGAAEAKAKAVSEHIAKRRASALREYEAQRVAVATLTAALSSLRAEAARATDLVRVEASLREILKAPSGTMAELAVTAEAALAHTRSQADTLTRLYSDLVRLVERLGAQGEERIEAQLAAVSSELAVRDAELASAQAALELAAAALQELQRESPRMASLAQLREHGTRLGLVDGACPLCGTQLSADDFNLHLQVIQDHIGQRSAELEAITARAADARTQTSRLQSAVARLRDEIANLESQRSNAREELARVTAQLSDRGVRPASDKSSLLEATTAKIESLRGNALGLEAALATLRASQSASQLSDREKELESAKAQLSIAEGAVSRASSAEASVKESVRIIRRVQGELIDEQLAAVSPMLTEIFQRLRPHMDWRTVKYNLRGDVRRMLSLEVGDGLNPSFMFSSGQRRAAGLAFLLAIHLSRGWCGLKTLILDDPVQHVDDFRALHLTEVLTAIRREHTQVICTGEDAALAELLARRLRVQGGESGALVRLGYESGRGAQITEQREVSPHERRVLVA